MIMELKDIQENKQLDNIIDIQVDYLYDDILTELNKHNRRHHKYTVKKQKELTKLICQHIILCSKMMEVIQWIHKNQYINYINYEREYNVDKR